VQKGNDNEKDENPERGHRNTDHGKLAARRKARRLAVLLRGKWNSAHPSFSKMLM